MALGAGSLLAEVAGARVLSSDAFTPPSIVCFTGAPGRCRPSFGATLAARPSVLISSDGTFEFDLASASTIDRCCPKLSYEDGFITMMQAANRANVSCYPADPARLFSGQHSLDSNRALETMISITDAL